MTVGRVVGTATSTRKHPSLGGQKLLVVQPLAADGRTPDGEPILAVDVLGAGRSMKVILSSDGQHTQELLGDMKTPVRWTVLGIQD
jgi:ethanolamine utilization protein EutN